MVTASSENSARTLTRWAYASFVPIGGATVLLGPMLPILSGRWGLNYAQAGRLFPTQYIASTIGVMLSGVVVARWGYRFAITAGLALAAVGVGFLLAGPQALGMACIAAYGAGLGVAVPAGNLLVAEVNPGRRSATLNLLNCFWSSGAVASPFLIAAAAKRQQVPLLLGLAAGLMVLIAVGIAAMPSWVVEPAVAREEKGKGLGIDWKHPALPSLAALFFIYVGTENGFGLWVATYAKSLGSLSVTMALMTPSFFYFALLVGRWLAPLPLRVMREAKLAPAGLAIACIGMGGLMFSHALPGVVTSAALAGLGLAAVYPITIAMLSLEFGASATRVGSLMFTLSNLGGGALPWVVGVSSTRLGTLKAGLSVPLIGSVVMFLLFQRNWKTESGADQRSVK